MSTEFWSSFLKGVCPCLTDFNVIKTECEKPCPYEPLKNILLSNKKPTKLKLIRTLLLTGLFTHDEINICILHCYPRIKRQTLANYFTTVKSDLEKKGYIVFRDTNLVYKAIKVEQGSGSTKI